MEKAATGKLKYSTHGERIWMWWGVHQGRHGFCIERYKFRQSRFQDKHLAAMHGWRSTVHVLGCTYVATSPADFGEIAPVDNVVSIWRLE